MKVLITGANGMLGRTLLRELQAFTLVPTDIETDITDVAQIDAALARHRPDCVIHCAAMTAVDRCERERERAFRVNATGSENVARACARHGARLIAISTDYVFPGDAGPYAETDPADGGKTVYGQSKYEGERRILEHAPHAVIARVAWLYGDGGPSFVHTMLALADGSRPTLNVVDDQRGNPTSALAVARHLRLLLLRPGLSGVFHLTCEGEATWHGFACEIFRLKGIPQHVIPCTTAEYPRPAPRPPDTRLAKTRLQESALPPMPHWKDALAEFLFTM
ncbi:MAG: dTDP-4-dehydrorhamnose reductase [Kiritimatiellaeota bacterium]|nr:dTDP-4-dehydrorhamnose reductase [Kiritimatiellota bacterium]